MKAVDREGATRVDHEAVGHATSVTSDWCGETSGYQPDLRGIDR